MGSAQSILTPEAASAITTGVIVAGAIAIGVSTRQGPESTEGAPQESTSSSTTSKKGKKKKGKAGPSATSASNSLTVDSPARPMGQPQVLEAPAAIPGGIDSLSSSETSQNTTKKKNKKAKKTKAAPKDDATPTPTSRPSPSLQDSTASVDTDSSWTRVDPTSKRSQEARPGLSTDTEGGDAPTTDDEQLPLSSSAERPGNARRPLAERMLPKPRKTGVEDMLQTPDYPAIARVVRAKPNSGHQPDLGSSWASHDDLTSSVAETTEAEREDDDGWGVVKSRSNRSNRQQTNRPTNAGIIKPTSTPDALTKRQRQNAKKRDAAKAAKAEGEQDRLVQLKKHKSELERIKMLQQATGRGEGGSKSQSASIDSNGKLVWE